LFGAFRKQVSHELTLAEFADAFAQTLAYGLFLAKLNDAANKEITLANAKTFIPQSVGLIRELVGFLDNLDRPEYADIAWVIEEVLSIINGLKLAQLIEDLSFRNRKAKRGTQAGSEEEWRLFSRDPFIYFYEDYLAKYDAKLKKSRGVYYTPPPIVNFIVRAIHDILKDSFGIPTGLADHNRVTVLDFACGTGTFLVEVLEQIFEEIGPDSGKAGQIVSDHILKNIFGFEYLIAPYTIAHLKLGQYPTMADADELGAPLLSGL
jgi:predicted helicase